MTESPGNEFKPRAPQRKPVRRVRWDDVPFKLWKADGMPFGILIRVINEHPDPANGGRTLVVDIPPGWESSKPHWHSCEEEYMVAEGELEVGDRVYKANQYVFRPAGQVHGPIRSPKGARLFYWHNSAFDYRTDAPPAGIGGGKPFIDGVDAMDEGLRTAATEILSDVAAYTHSPVSPQMVMLRSAEETGDEVVMLWQPRGFVMDVLSVHAGTEEAFIIGRGWTGDETNIYHGGNYLCWLPGTIHGPVAGWEALVLTKHYGGYTNPPIPLVARYMDIGVQGVE